MKILLKYLPLLPALLLFASCSEKGSEEPHPATLYDLCDIASNNGAAVFNLYRPDSDNPIVLTAPGEHLGAIEEGTTVVISYTPVGGVPYVSDNISLYDWRRINNLPLLQTRQPADLVGWDKDPVWLTSIWRGGEKIYMRLNLMYSAEPRRFSLVIDSETIDDPVPTAYLFHWRPSDTPDFKRQYYAAFDISALWERSSVEGIRVVMNNAADPALSTFIFRK